MQHPSFEIEQQYWDQEITMIAGIDEVGMGALAGPVVAGAVVFEAEPPSNSPLSGGEQRRDATKINKGLAYLPYFQRLTEQAREMRNKPTRPEEVMWKEILSRNPIKQHRFRRQKPLQRFIADFYSPALLLVIEVDGDSHDKEYDDARTEALTDYGIQVIRYTNEEVVQNPERVRDDLNEKIAARSQKLFPPDRGGKGGLIRDSKTLSPAQREKSAVWIQKHCLAWAVGEASVAEINELNIRQAAQLAMKRAVEQLQPVPEMLLVDGDAAQPHPAIPAENVVKGDRLSFSIAAASIVAKVHRDRIMVEMAEKHPEYGFEAHKGYGTKQHQEALRRHGALPHHRAAYAPVAHVLTKV